MTPEHARYYDWIFRFVLEDCRSTFWIAKMLDEPHVEILVDFKAALTWLENQKTK